jgi:hypothetical protein
MTTSSSPLAHPFSRFFITRANMFAIAAAQQCRTISVNARYFAVERCFVYERSPYERLRL